MIFDYMKTLNDSIFKFKMYIDYDPINKVFYHNFFFDEYSFVLKLALTPILNNNDNFWDIPTRDEDCPDLKYEKFDLSQYVYLLHFS